jgi:hypothetical protein
MLIERPSGFGLLFGHGGPGQESNENQGTGASGLV